MHNGHGQASTGGVATILIHNMISGHIRPAFIAVAYTRSRRTIHTKAQKPYILARIMERWIRSSDRGYHCNMSDAQNVSTKVSGRRRQAALHDHVGYPRGSRSYTMSRIRGKDTKPEILVRSYLFSRGLRFRKNDPRYPGKPDIILPKYHTAVFVNGCFWHQHQGCPYARIPRTNVEFWTEKLLRNRNRDAAEIKELTNLGWHVITVWECELKKPKQAARLARLYDQITSEGNPR